MPIIQRGLYELIQNSKFKTKHFTMIDTNQITQIANSAAVAAPAVQSAFNAWIIIAAGAGGLVVHAYHTIVNGGGVKNIFLRLWSGNPTSK
jgi:hypothetical protein